MKTGYSFQITNIEKSSNCKKQWIKNYKTYSHALVCSFGCLIVFSKILCEIVAFGKE